eukprot:TRINITY_DN6254_c0_g1_i1.p1 TRINITY_DN6254_c0_g1~~TRINITY_DN6254_c0_g1_i1.p1  ORF type:complete len:403 (+),score=52.74 TRINITY_DN6254_c0_g1_i1:36-1244(+)
MPSTSEQLAILPHLAKLPVVEYQIAIPTFQRWRQTSDVSTAVRFKDCKEPFILSHTLRFLSNQAVPKNRVTLFVANTTELARYRIALLDSDWEDVAMQISAPGNKSSRNFITSFFEAGTYVVSFDDDIEKITWKFRPGRSKKSLKDLPPGGLEAIIFHAFAQMKKKKAYLWGLNSSKNPLCMSTQALATCNGLVNGNLHGFICRPLSPDLLRTLSDATEDSEFSVRHFAMDGIVLRYRMYAVTTYPYRNKGGLQHKFVEGSGSSAARKAEERQSSLMLHELFPKLVGFPRERKMQHTMEVNFLRDALPPLLHRQQRRPEEAQHQPEDICAHVAVRFQPLNPKRPGTGAYLRYNAYKHAQTLGQALRCGARLRDIRFDASQGFLSYGTRKVSKHGLKKKSKRW